MTTENKTRPTDASVEDDIAARASAGQRADCGTLMAMLKWVTRLEPKSGRAGVMCLDRFAMRGREIAGYPLASGPELGRRGRSNASPGPR